MSSVAQGPVPVLRIRPTRGWAPLQLAEVWNHRELLYFLTWREIKVRYKQTLIGAAWAMIQPLSTMTIFSLFLGRLAQMPSDGIPYPVFSLAGLVPWIFFANGVSGAAKSLVGNSNLLTSIYFPRLAIPISSVLSGIFDVAVALVLLVALACWYGIGFTWTILWIPGFVLLALTAATGVGLWLSALNVQYRDVQYITPAIIQIWMFATPIIYPGSLLHEPWRTAYGLNPMVGVVDGFRWALLGDRSIHTSVFASSAAGALTLLVTGAYYFRSMERRFADVV